MSWFEKLMPSRIRVDANKNKKVIPEGVWEKCLNCQTVLYREDICITERSSIASIELIAL